MLRREPPRWVDFDHARLELARLKLSDSGTVDVLFARAVEICSRALNVDRVGVWSLDPTIPGLCCVHLLDRKEPAVAGDRLRQNDLGRYAHALMECRFIASSDVRADDTMADLVTEYFAPRSIVSTLDVPLYRDGEVVGVLCHEHRGSPRVWTDEEGDFAISVADMLAHALTTSDLVAALEQLREEERTRHDALRAEALGRVARGLTHDLGNSLQSILLQSEYLLRVADDPERVREATHTIRDLAAHAGRLTIGVREFARGVDAKRVLVGVDALVGRTADALRALAGADRALTVSLGAADAMVLVDPMGFERALANLVVNAREATRPGGVIAVSTSADVAAVQVAVSDDGHGMDEATRARAFDPFFSTRDEDAQRGFGLSIVAAVVRAAQGEVSVRSTPGAGARFEIRLPRGAEP